jgi:DNA-binding Lrp family transcriptional regulator
MLADDIIKRYTVVVDEEVFGRTVSGLVLLTVKTGLLEEVVGQLLKQKIASTIYEIHGSHDLILKIGGINLEDLRNQIIKIQEIPHITSSELITIYKIWKDDGV